MWRTDPTAISGRVPLPAEAQSAVPVAPRAAHEEPPRPRSGAGSVAVPDLIGMASQDARRVARLAELGVIVEELPAGDGLRGHVFRQVPEAGSLVPPGEVVTVYIGARPAVTVPDLRGLDEHDSLAVLQELGLVPSRRVLRRSSGIAQGHILRTRPRAGTEVPVGTRITYVVASAPRLRATPRHEGKRSRVQRMPDGSFVSMPDEE